MILSNQVDDRSPIQITVCSGFVYYTLIEPADPLLALTVSEHLLTRKIFNFLSSFKFVAGYAQRLKVCITVTTTQVDWHDVV